MADDRVLIVDGAQHHKWTRETFEDIREGDISAINITLGHLGKLPRDHRGDRPMVPAI